MSSVFGGGGGEGQDKAVATAEGARSEVKPRGTSLAKRHNRLVMRCADRLFLGRAAGQCVAGASMHDWKQGVCGDVALTLAMRLCCLASGRRRTRTKTRTRTRRRRSALGMGARMQQGRVGERKGTVCVPDIWQAAHFCDVAVSCPGAHALLTAPASWYAV